MKKLCFALAALCGTMLVAPAQAQNYPTGYGDYVSVTEITVDDGHNLDFANYLAGQWRAQVDFAKAQGWITGYEVLANIDKRKDGADIYILRRFKSMPDAAESERRANFMRDHLKLTDAQIEASSGDRAKYRHVMGSELLLVITFK